MNVSSLSSFGGMRPDPTEMRAQMFKDTDADGSGTISKDELTQRIANAPKPPGASETEETPDVEEMFSQIDADGDGEISETENNAFLEAREAEGPKGPPPQQYNADGTSSRPSMGTKFSARI